MALADKVSTPPPTFHGLPCSIGALLDELEPAERDALQKMLDSTAWNATMIYDAVRDEGHQIGRQSINRHRGRKCRCFRVVADR